MRYWLLVLLVLLLGSCSCQRQPDADAVAQLPVDAALPGNAPAPETRPAIPDALAATQAAANAAQQAASTLHAYLGALPATDRSRADAYWSGGNPGAPAGDALLRGIADLRGMRIHNDPPQALDRESPPRAFEIPVHLRVETGDGMHRLQGHYRMRARIDGQGWEITSAALQPQLD
jgi:hypothetical protein